MKEFKTVLVNEVVKTILGFLNGPKKLVFVRIYRSTIIGVAGPPYTYCWLVELEAVNYNPKCSILDVVAVLDPLIMYMLKVNSDHTKNVKLYIYLAPCSNHEIIVKCNLVSEVFSFHVISAWVVH